MKTKNINDFKDIVKHTCSTPPGEKHPYIYVCLICGKHNTIFPDVNNNEIKKNKYYGTKN